MADSRPDTETLRRYLGGELEPDDAADIEAWLTADPLASAILDGLRADDLSSTSPRPSDRPPIQLTPPESGTPARTVEAPVGPPRQTARSDPRSLLRPPQGADEIGRLGGYRVLGILGRGGMGVVFRAEEVVLGRLVALKVIDPVSTTAPDARARFLREARAAAKVTGDHIVPVLAVGEADGTLFLAMPLLEGLTLQQRLARDGRLPLTDLIRLARQSAAGLAAAHAKGLIHRDIKPANLWLEPTPEGDRVKILDFGLARSTVEAGDSLTDTGISPGTPAYMSPEQVRAEPLDARTDLFSLGAVLYEAATGRRAFPGRSNFETCRNVVDLTPPSPREICPDIPRCVSNAIMCLLTKDLTTRTESAAAVVSFGASQPPPSDPRRFLRRWAVWVGLGLAAALLIVVIVIISRRNHATDATSSPETTDTRSEPATLSITPKESQPSPAPEAVDAADITQRGGDLESTIDNLVKTIDIPLRKIGERSITLSRIASPTGRTVTAGSSILFLLDQKMRRIGYLITDQAKLSLSGQLFYSSKNGTLTIQLIITDINNTVLFTAEGVVSDGKDIANVLTPPSLTLPSLPEK